MSRHITERTIVREAPSGVTERITIRGDPASVDQKIAELQSDSSLRVKEVPSGIQRSAIPREDIHDPGFVNETVTNLRRDPDYVTERITTFSGNPTEVGRRVNELANRNYFDPETVNIIRGENSTRTSVESSSKGNVVIQEASPEGTFVTVENPSNDDTNISDWQLRRRADGTREVVFTFPRDFVLRAGRSITIWARNQGHHHSPPNELVLNEDSFGVGSIVHTTLHNQNGEERAKHVQRTV